MRKPSAAAKSVRQMWLKKSLRPSPKIIFMSSAIRKRWATSSNAWKPFSVCHSPRIHLPHGPKLEKNCGARSEQLVALGFEHGLRAVEHPEFLENLVHMDLDSLFADLKFFGDHLVGVPLSHEAQHLFLSGR